jgi:hypothetical protein
MPSLPCGEIELPVAIAAEYHMAENSSGSVIM